MQIHNRSGEGRRPFIAVAAAFAAAILVPMAGVSAQTQTECETRFVGEGETQVEDCPDQTGSSTGGLLFNFASELRNRIAQQRRPRQIAQGGDEQTAANGMALGGAASADSDVEGVSGYGRLSPFGIVDYTESDRDRTAAGNAYEQDATSLILGADYRFSNSLFAGGTLNVLTGDTEFDGDESSTEVDGYVLGLHGSRYFADNMFMDLLVTYGELEVDVDRVDPFGDRFTASPDGDVYSAEMAVGHNYSRGRLRITPLGKLMYMSGSVDAYEEERQSRFGRPERSVERQRFDSANLQLSVQADYVFLTGWGVLIPSLNVAYHREESDADTTRVSAAGRQSLQRTDNPDRNTVVVRAGVSAQLQRGWSAFASYEELFEHDYLDRYNAVVGVRYEIF